MEELKSLVEYKDGTAGHRKAKNTDYYICSPVVKHWKSPANTALFSHGCFACWAGRKDLLHFIVFRSSLLADTLLPQWSKSTLFIQRDVSKVRCKSLQGYASQGSCFMLFSHAGGQHNE